MPKLFHLSRPYIVNNRAVGPSKPGEPLEVKDEVADVLIRIHGLTPVKPPKNNAKATSRSTEGVAGSQVPPSTDDEDDDQDTSNTLPDDMPGRDALVDNGMTSLADVREYEGEWTDLEGVDEEIGGQIAAYLEANPANNA